MDYFMVDRTSVKKKFSQNGKGLFIYLFGRQPSFIPHESDREILPTFLTLRLDRLMITQ